MQLLPLVAGARGITRSGKGVRRHGDRDGHRDRSHLRDADRRAGRQDLAHPPDGPARGAGLRDRGPRPWQSSRPPRSAGRRRGGPRRCRSAG